MSRQRCWRWGWYWWVAPGDRPWDQQLSPRESFRWTDQAHPPSHQGQWALDLEVHTYLLVLSVMAGDGPMGGLSLNCLPIRTDQHRRHQAEGAKAWGWADVPSRSCFSSRPFILDWMPPHLLTPIPSPLQLRGPYSPHRQLSSMC